MIKAPAFWWHAGWQGRLLRPLGTAYGAVSGMRMRRPARHHAAVPVIAIGNLTAGGAGKTPTAIAVTGAAIAIGHSPIVLMRGYGGSERGPRLVDADHDTAREVGDEALMIARVGLPVVVARDRAAGADLAIACGGDLIVMDDGFQSPGLAKDLSLVVIDSVAGIGNGEIVPAGPLRAPLDLQIDRLDALMVISNGVVGTAADAIADRVRAGGKPVFTAEIVADAAAPDFSGRHVVAFAGIGRPAKLAEGLRSRGAIVDELVGFADHHRYSADDARALLARVDGTDRDRVLVTTAKDMARLTSDPDPVIRALAARTQVAAVRLTFDAPDAVSAFLAGRLGLSRTTDRPASTGIKTGAPAAASIPANL